MSFIKDHFVLPKEPKSYKDMFLSIFLAIGVGFGFGALNHVDDWRAPLLAGIGIWLFLSVLPTIIFNLLYWIGKIKNR